MELIRSRAQPETGSAGETGGAGEVSVTGFDGDLARTLIGNQSREGNDGTISFRPFNEASQGQENLEGFRFERRYAEQLRRKDEKSD